MQFDWNNKYQQFLSSHVRYLNPHHATLKKIDLLKKVFFPRKGEKVSRGRAHEYLRIAGIYYFNLTAFYFFNLGNNKLPTILRYSNVIWKLEINTGPFDYVKLIVNQRRFMFSICFLTYLQFLMQILSILVSYSTCKRYYPHSTPLLFYCPW